MTNQEKIAVLDEQIQNVEAAKEKLATTYPDDEFGRRQQKRLAKALDRRLRDLQDEKDIRKKLPRASGSERKKMLKKLKRLNKKYPGLYRDAAVAAVCVECDRVDQLANFYDRGHTAYTVEEYTKLMEEKLGPLSDKQASTLARGCIGITALNLGPNGLPNPPLDECYSSVAQAVKRQKQLRAATGRTPALFSKLFHASGTRPDGTRFDKKYPADPKTGRVDMSQYDIRRDNQAGRVNFDYGYYDPKTKSWWHANHKQPGMVVYRSTLDYYSNNYPSYFDGQVF